MKNFIRLTDFTAQEIKGVSVMRPVKYDKPCMGL